MSVPVLAPTATILPTLLIVDDEEGPRHSLRMVFKKDFEVYAVENGDKALDYARSHPISLAILDIRMAGKSGAATLAALVDGGHLQIIRSC